MWELPQITILRTNSKEFVPKLSSVGSGITTTLSSILRIRELRQLVAAFGEIGSICGFCISISHNVPD